MNEDDKLLESLLITEDEYSQMSAAPYSFGVKMEFADWKHADVKMANGTPEPSPYDVEAFLEAAKPFINPNFTISRTDATHAQRKAGIPFPKWLTSAGKTDDGLYSVEKFIADKENFFADVKPEDEEYLHEEILPVFTAEKGVSVPNKNPLYIKYGFFEELKTILSSNIFYPVYITGQTGTGKTEMVEQVCAELGRTMVRVNITVDTDEDDLIGGQRLSEGSSVWHNGPVVEALTTGSVLLVDEIDLGSPKLMCLQQVLEGKGIYVKKTNTFIPPKPGFTVIATANTKGRGSEDGRYVGTNMMNEAFLERFSLTYEQDYPSEAIEKKILTRIFKKHGLDEPGLPSLWAIWARQIRESFSNGAIDDIITTRRLCMMAMTYVIFKDERKAVEYCMKRFDKRVQEAFMVFYDNLRPAGTVTKSSFPKGKSKLVSNLVNY